MSRRPPVRTAPRLPPLHLFPSLPCHDRLPTLLQPRPIEWAQAPTRSADWTRSLASWAMRAARWARRCRSASSRWRVGSAPWPRGRLRGSSCTGACAHLWVCWEVCTVCVVISYHYLTSTTLKRRWEGAWGSATLNLVQPNKKPRCASRRAAQLLPRAGDELRLSESGSLAGLCLHATAGEARRSESVCCTPG